MAPRAGAAAAAAARPQTEAPNDKGAETHQELHFKGDVPPEGPLELEELQGLGLDERRDAEGARGGLRRGFGGGRRA